MKKIDNKNFFNFWTYHLLKEDVRYIMTADLRLVVDVKNMYRPIRLNSMEVLNEKIR